MPCPSVVAGSRLWCLCSQLAAHPLACEERSSFSQSSLRMVQGRQAAVVQVVSIARRASDLSTTHSLQPQSGKTRSTGKDLQC